MTLRESLRLYLVADPDHCKGDLTEAVVNAIQGGITCVQLRAKSLNDREHLQLARQLREACASSAIPFIVNDRLDIALAANADGLHVGVDDLPVQTIRSLMGPEFIIGYSPESDAQIIGSKAEGADYLGVGPIYGTRTKSDAGSALGIEEFRRRCELSPIPVVGIGGIGAGSAREVLIAGGDGVAVVSAILHQADPRAAAESIRRQAGI